MSSGSLDRRILDLFSRKVIGWAISKHIDAELALTALRQAIQTREPPAGCVHHSDRGVQYLCKEYVALLKAHGLEISNSAKGNLDFPRFHGHRPKQLS